MRQNTISLEKAKWYYITELDNYKTTSSKKAFLTRSRKEQEVWHDDLVWAYNRSNRMLHGESVSLADVKHAWSELKIINEIYKTL